jgi:nucleoside-diphosphate-sugar epimerase
LEVVAVRVLVTGGTGFVGSHTVAALVARGHDIRLLVRSPDRIAPALQPLGLTGPVDHVVGDVTDPDSVARALLGCDAVVHAAAVYSLDSRAYREIGRTNVRGAETVLGAAVRHGCDPVVHVSSVAALVHPRATVTADSPLSTARGVYVQSKVASEAVARRLQQDGAPVVIVHPGGALGPHDPHLSDQVQRLRNVLRGRYPVWPSGGYHQVDVREVAALHAAVLSPVDGPRRYIVPGHYVDGRTMFGTLRTVTGRRIRHLIVPARQMLPAGRLASAVQRALPVHLPAEYEGVLFHSYDTRCDDSPACQELGVHPRPLVETYRDTVRWLHRAGRLTARQAGAAAQTGG